MLLCVVIFLSCVLCFGCCVYCLCSCACCVICLYFVFLCCVVCCLFCVVLCMLGIVCIACCVCVVGCFVCMLCVLCGMCVCMFTCECSLWKRRKKVSVTLELVSQVVISCSASGGNRVRIPLLKHFLTWWSMVEGPAHCRWSHPWLVILDCLRKQAEQARKQHPLCLLHQLLPWVPALMSWMMVYKLSAE